MDPSGGGRGAARRRIRALWTRFVRGPVEEYRWWLLAVAAIVVVVLGYHGFSQAQAARTWTFWDKLYRSVQLFALESVNPPVPGLLQASRWMALSITVLATFGAFAAIFREQVGRVRVRLARGHVLICGLGRCGVRLARGFLDEGYRVVAVERDPLNPAIEPSRRAGIVVLVGDSTDRALLRKVGLGRAHSLIAVCGEDGPNVSVALAAQDLVTKGRRRPLHCFVHSVDPQLAEFLRELAITTPAAEVFRLDAFDVSDLGAAGMLTRHPPFDTAGTTPLGPPHLAVVGLGQAGTRVVLDAAQSWVTVRAPGSPQLRVTVVDREAEERLETVRLRYPWLEEVCDLVPVTVDVDRAAFQRPGLLDDPDGVERITGVYVCLDDDVRGLRTALLLRQRLARTAVPIVVGTRERATSTMPSLGEAIPEDVHLFRMLDRACTPEILRSGMNEVLARAIHEEYVRNERERGGTLETNPSLAEWEAIPEHLRESSRHQATHIGDKLRAVGREILPIGAAPRLDAVSFQPEELELMARMEHDRWWRERAEAGWAPAPVKDIERKLTPYLVPWEELPEDKRENDRDFVRALPNLLAKVGFAIVRVERTARAETASQPSG